MLDLNWADIVTTDQYQNDLARITTILSRSLADDLIDPNLSSLIFPVAHLVCVYRYFASNLPSTKDLDLSPFLAQIQAEVGVNLPLTSEIPVVEFLRENKAWYGHKGAESIYNFIGSVVGSPIELEYPKDLIFELSNSKTALSGADTGMGILPWPESKWGHIRDGIYWARYTYVLNILQAQNIVNYQDLENLIVAVHPAGEKRFVNAYYNYMLTSPAPSLFGTMTNLTDNFFIENDWPTLDNNWILSGPAKLSMHNGDIFLTNFSFQLIQKISIDSLYHRLWSDTTGLTHRYLMDYGPQAAFSRDIGQGDGTYVTVYSDNDPIVYENVTTNVGVAGYTIGNLKTLTIRELKNAAMNLDSQNMRGMFMPELLLSSQTVS